MKARLIAVGERAPTWVAQGFAEYQKRLSHWLPLELVEVEPGVRGKGRDTAKAMADEGARVLAALPKNTFVVALDGRGKPHSSEQLAVRLEGNLALVDELQEGAWIVVPLLPVVSSGPQAWEEILRAPRRRSARCPSSAQDGPRG